MPEIAETVNLISRAVFFMIIPPPGNQQGFSMRYSNASYFLTEMTNIGKSVIGSKEITNSF